MLPPFDLQGGLLLALTRAAAVAGLLFVFGAMVFRVVVMPRVIPKLSAPDAARVTRRLRVIAQSGTAAALVCTTGWLVVQAGSIAAAGSLRDLAAAVPLVALHTKFGHLLLMQLAALAALAALGGTLAGNDGQIRRWAGLGLAGIALGLQAGHGHAAAMADGPSVLLALDLLHLAAAGAWLGGLLPLLLVIHDAPPRAGATAARWFSPLGKWCVGALAISAIGQSWVLVGSLAAFVGTAYGWLLLAKLVLFAVLLAFAAANRYRFAPALLNLDPEPARAVLVRSIAIQSGFGLAIICAAAVLSSLPPAIHVQTVWPFAQRFSLDTVSEDADFRNEALGAALALAGALVLLAAALILRRRLSWPLAGAALAIGYFAIPHLSLLFVPAYPTSYFHSPTQFAATSILDGAASYPSHCAVCHGADGQGDGPAAASLPVPPADLTATHLWMHSDGELFWWLAHGITAPDGRQAMPGFASALSDDQLWALIDFIRARNAGQALHATGSWPAPLPAPGLQATCAGPRTVSLADLRHGFIRLVIGPAAPVPGATTILLGPHGAAKPGPGLCTTDDPTLTDAYTIAGGLTPSQAQGAEFLVDEAGWLRSVQPPGTLPGWNDPGLLAAEIARLKAHTVAAPAADGMNMNMKM